MTEPDYRKALESMVIDLKVIADLATASGWRDHLLATVDRAEAILPPKIAPCPFCGGGKTQLISTEKYNPASNRAVRCCNCCAQSGTWGSDAEAIAAWNRRAAEKRG